MGMGKQSSINPRHLLCNLLQSLRKSSNYSRISEIKKGPQAFFKCSGVLFTYGFFFRIVVNENGLGLTFDYGFVYHHFTHVVH